MTRQSLDFYKEQVKNSSLDTLKTMIDQAGEMPANQKRLFYAAINRGMVENVRSAIARYLYTNQPTEY
jgi:hypothetical protein